VTRAMLSRNAGNPITHTPAKAPLTNLRVNQPGNSFELEADHAAAPVMSGSGRLNWSFSQASSSLQRKCSCGTSGGQSECEECKQQNNLQRKSSGSAPNSPGFAPPIVHEVLRSPGQPLDAQTRNFFEPRFGRSFNNVRVHADESSEKSARAINAEAYTVGNQIVFDSGRFAPGTAHGKKLLAHELAHVSQQSGHVHHPSSLKVGAAHDSFEREADHVAETILSGHHAGLRSSTSGTVLQRQTPPTSPGPPAMQGPDWGLTCGTDGCTLNTPAGDAPLSGKRYRCYMQAVQGHCPADCVEELAAIGVPCPQVPRLPHVWPPPGPPPTIPQCPPGQIPYSGRCLPLRPPTPQPPPTQPQPAQPQSVPSGSGPLRVPSPSGPGTRVGIGTIESQTLDNFALNEAAVPSQHSGTLAHIASLLNIYRDVEVHIEGHTDGSGSEAINTPLARRRAEAVRAELIRLGVVNPGRLRAQGFSSHQPAVTPSTPSAQEPHNRRVEIWYYIPPSRGMGEGLRLRTTP
jgi:outer membrane protein OmpA-like peptidoglycan-associated protein